MLQKKKGTLLRFLPQDMEYIGLYWMKTYPSMVCLESYMPLGGKERSHNNSKRRPSAC